MIRKATAADVDSNTSNKMVVIPTGSQAFIPRAIPPLLPWKKAKCLCWNRRAKFWPAWC